jgi:hypothetical protein
VLRLIERRKTTRKKRTNNSVGAIPASDKAYPEQEAVVHARTAGDPVPETVEEQVRRPEDEEEPDGGRLDRLEEPVREEQRRRREEEGPAQQDERVPLGRVRPHGLRSVAVGIHGNSRAI